MATINETYSLLVVFIGVILMFLYVYGVKGLQFRNIIFLGFILRVIILLADYFDWFPILNSGADSELFHQVSEANVRNYTNNTKTNYTIVVTLIYQITNCSRILAQFFNVLLGTGIILMVQSMLRRLDVDYQKMKYAILILALMPNINIFSAILLREAWIEFFVTLSLYCFVRWFISGGVHFIILCIAAVLSATFMHSGIVTVLVGYIVAFIVYRPSTETITISRSTVTSIIFLVAISALGSSYMGMFTGKFNEYDNINDIVDVTNKTTGGGSDYLKWINVNSVGQSLLFAPLKMFYFLFSPLPTEWRGVRDLFGFAIDGGVYLYMFISIYRDKAATQVTKHLKKFLLVSILVVSFVFGYGTTNAGTAFRHRGKMIALVVVAFAISAIKPSKYGKEEECSYLPELKDVESRGRKFSS